MKQTASLQQKPALSQNYDFTDVQSFAASAESVALKLIEEYGGDIKKIEEAVKTKDVGGFTGVSDVDFAEEVVWAAQNILKIGAMA